MPHGGVSTAMGSSAADGLGVSGMWERERAVESVVFMQANGRKAGGDAVNKHLIEIKYEMSKMC